MLRTQEAGCIGSDEAPLARYGAGDETFIKIFIKDAWEMVHTLQQQAEELEKEFDVKMEYLRAFFAGMRWAGTK